MGVPKFFRWISERYPLAVQRHGCPINPETFYLHYGARSTADAGDNGDTTTTSSSPPLPTYVSPPDPLSTCPDLPPPIDRLYIDMNGLIHGCSHNNLTDEKETQGVEVDNPLEDNNNDNNDNNNKSASPQLRSQEDIFADLCYYLDRLVRDIAQPQSLLFLAVDGVAPRAKLNQQRARRYRSSQEGAIERTVYDAHLHHLELQQQQQQQQDENNENGTTDAQQQKANFDQFSYDWEQDMSSSSSKINKSTSSFSSSSTSSDSTHPSSEVKEHDGRFTGKFETSRDDTTTSTRFPVSSNRDSNSNQEDEDEDDNGDEAFHSNSITPGTPFFQECTRHLEHFIQAKISTDPAWQHLQVILSGSNTPGEGEHKILQFMREQQSLPDYNPNLRHCIMGQDGDLIMLGLASHEPNLILLRERVLFEQTRRFEQERLAQTHGLGVYLHQAHFEFLHMNLLRDYLALEFATSNVLPDSPYDLEATIDDFVFLTFLVGNDFLPSLPALDIGDDGIDLLFYTYRDQRKRWMAEYQQKIQQQQEKQGGGNGTQQQHSLPRPPYLTHAGDIVSGKRLEQFLQQVGSYESKYYDYKDSTTDMDDIRRMEAKWGHATTPDDDILESKEAFDREKYRALVAHGAQGAGPDATNDGFKPVMASTVQMLEVEEDVEEDEAQEQEGLMNRIGSLFRSTVQDEAPGATGVAASKIKDINDRDFKGRYYADKFGFSPYDKDNHLHLRKSYIEGLVWTLKYYYHKPVSWSWYYPYHYCPMISDLTGLDKIIKDIKFEKGAPLLPYEQLLACMPASNAKLLPKPYRKLMTDPNSPLQDFYPTSFTVDMNGKRWPWEAVVLLPFLDSKKLLDATSKIDKSELTEEERQRNVVKESMLFYRDPSMSPRKLNALDETRPQFSTVDDCQTAIQPLSQSQWHYDEKKAVRPPIFQPKLQEGVEVPLDGFPTLRDGSVYSMKRKALRLNIHGTPSRYHTALLDIRNELPEVIPVDTLARLLVGTEIYINYPFMTPAFVTAVSDSRGTIRGKGGLHRPWTPGEALERKNRLKSIFNAYTRGARLTGTGGMSIAGISDSKGGGGGGKPEQIMAEILISVRPLKRIQTLEDGKTTGKVFAKFETEVPLFVTSWKPVNPDKRLDGLALLLEKDPYHAARANVRSTGATTELHVVASDASEAIAGDAPLDRIPFRQAAARGYSTLARNGHVLNNSIKDTKRSFGTNAFACLPSPQLKRSEPLSFLASSSNSRQINRPAATLKRLSTRRVPAHGKWLVAGALAAAWLVGGASAAASGFWSDSRKNPSSLSSPNSEWKGHESYAVPSLDQATQLSGGGTESPIASSSVPRLEVLHGTTTLAFVHKDGIVVAVDSRASLGTFIGSKTTQKVLPIHAKLLGTMAGGAADCQFWIRKIAARAALFQAEQPNGKPMTVVRASHYLSNILYQYRSLKLSMGTMLMGYDENETGTSFVPVLVYVDDQGTRLEGDLFSVGSGCTYAYSILDQCKAEDRYQLSREEAIALAVQAIRYATLRDGSSGGFINVYYVRPGQAWERVFRQDVAALMKEEKKTQ